MQKCMNQDLECQAKGFSTNFQVAKYTWKLAFYAKQLRKNG